MIGQAALLDPFLKAFQVSAVSQHGIGRHAALRLQIIAKGRDVVMKSRHLITIGRKVAFLVTFDLAYSQVIFLDLVFSEHAVAVPTLSLDD